VTSDIVVVIKKSIAGDVYDMADGIPLVLNASESYEPENLMQKFKCEWEY